MKRILFFTTIFIISILFSTTIEVKVKTVPKSPPKVLIKPTLLLIPETKVMYVSNYEDFDIFYFDGFWFCYYEGYWWKTKELSKPWIKIEVKYVPKELILLPSEWKLKIKNRNVNVFEYKYRKEKVKSKKGAKNIR